MLTPAINKELGVPAARTTHMQFTKHLHEPIRAGVVTCSIRIWKRLHVKVGGKYRLGPGFEYIVVDAIEEIELDVITDALAIASGFESTEDLLKTARHGNGQNVYLIRFHYVDGNVNDQEKRWPS